MEGVHTSMFIDCLFSSLSSMSLDRAYFYVKWKEQSVRLPGRSFVLLENIIVEFWEKAYTYLFICFRPEMRSRVKIRGSPFNRAEAADSSYPEEFFFLQKQRFID
jgi:hypothetical protein